MITAEQCEEIQKFYELYVITFETKYKILYQTLQQAFSNRSRVLSSRISSAGLTPSLSALEDASTLKRKEWSRDEPSEDTHWMYTTIGGSLTPTAPVYGDMRADLTLNVASDIPAAVEGAEERESTQLPQDDERGSMTDVATPFTEVPETRPKVIQERSSQEELSRRSEVTRESSREDALATTRLFFNTVAERRNMNEVPITTTVSVSQIDTPPVSSAPVVTEPAELETPSPRTFLPSGSPPRLTATATCRPCTWVQQISEGQIEEHSIENEDLEENETLEPLVLEGLPDELGPEWRVLHPFEILGVRFPTEDTPPTHRRLAQNDALVELMQTS